MKLKNYITIYGTLLLVIAIIWTIPLAGYLAGKMSREDATTYHASPTNS